MTKKPFTPESLEEFLEETRIRNLLKRVNYGRSYPLRMKTGGNPYAAAVNDLGAIIDARLWIDEDTPVAVTIVASKRSEREYRKAQLSNPSEVPGADNELSILGAFGSLAASGSNNAKSFLIEDIKLRVDVSGYRVLDSTVKNKGVDTLGVVENGYIVFDETDSNHFVSDEKSKCELRVMNDGESYLLPLSQSDRKEVK